MPSVWLPTVLLPYSFQIGCMFPISVMIRFSASGPGLPFVDDIVEHSQLGGGPRKDEALDVGIQRDCAIRWYVSRDEALASRHNRLLTLSQMPPGARGAVMGLQSLVNRFKLSVKLPRE